MERRLGFVGEVYEQGDAGRLRAASSKAADGGGRGAARAGAAGAAAPPRSPGSALVLGGELALRWSVFKAGFQSARDPRYTVVPQRERLRATRS